MAFCKNKNNEEINLKCPRCGSLDTVIMDEEKLRNVGAGTANAIDPDLVKIIIAAITALGTIINSYINKSTQEKKQQKKFFLICKNCHILRELDSNTYNDTK
jgi:ssDNA-binding Zn-finger/Zn-ribbon topoisomerase 1